MAAVDCTAGGWVGAEMVGAALLAGAGAGVGAEAGGAAPGAAVAGVMTPAWFSSTSWRLPPQARAMACSSKVARLCTMPIQFPATCTTARCESIRTN